MSIPTSLDASFSSRGHWWLPDTPDRKVPGTLEFSPSKGLKLSLLGSLEADVVAALNQALSLSKDLGPAVVLGVDEHGGQLSLLECLKSNSRVGFGGGGLQVTEELLGRYLLTGAHLNVGQASIFDRAFVRYWALDEWAVRPGFTIQFTEAGGKTVSYSLPKRKRIARTGEVKVWMDTGHSGPQLSMVQREVTLSQQSVLRFQFAKRQSIEAILETVDVLARFLSLATGEAIYPLELTLQSPKVQMELGSGKRHRVPIALVFGLEAVQGLGDPPLPVSMNFSLPGVDDRIEDVATTWLNSAELLEPVWNLFFGAMYAPRMYLHFRFLSLAYAVESFHRRCRESDIDPVHEARHAAIMEGTPDEFRKWLADKLKYSHEPSFRKRIRALLAELGDLGEVFSQPEKKFVSNVVETRNALTHYEGDDGLAADSEGLYRLTQRLQGLVAVLLLVETGFTHDEVVAMVQGNSRFFQAILFSIGYENGNG